MPSTDDEPGKHISLWKLPNGEGTGAWDVLQWRWHFNADCITAQGQKSDRGTILLPFYKKMAQHTFTFQLYTGSIAWHSASNTKIKVEENLTLEKLRGWLSLMKEKQVSVQFPRFRIEDNFSLKEKLQAMGLQHIFSPEHASLPGKSICFKHNHN